MKSVYINRELSWLCFNERVLYQARDKETPLLERLKFLSIFRSNMDEFFMVRVGRLFDVIDSNIDYHDAITGMSAICELTKISAKTQKLIIKYNEAQKDLFKKLRGVGIKYVDDKKMPKKVFNEFAGFCCLGVMKASSFKNQVKSDEFVAVLFLIGNEKYVGLISFCENVKKVIVTYEEHTRFFLIEDAAIKMAKKMFEKYEVLSIGKFRITRSVAQKNGEENFCESDLQLALNDVLKRREKLLPIRIETNIDKSSELCGAIARTYNIDIRQIYTLDGPMDLSFVSKIVHEAKRFKKHLFVRQKRTGAVNLISGKNIVRQVDKRDALVLFPCNSFETIIELLKQAAVDKSVDAIYQTLYRLADKSKVIKFLIEAAKNGKAVTVAIELKARFDESNNIKWARMLKKHGCKVICGFEALKVHSKLLVVVRKNGKGARYTTHISTGNYNEKTAKLYTDIGIITCEKNVAVDALRFFSEVKDASFGNRYTALYMSPNGIREKLYELIDEQIERCANLGHARVVIKVNSLCDKDMINRLLCASSAGVKIDLVVRGICCLKAGAKNVSENIRVVSVVGRYLEHSRVYIFGEADNEKVFISSADLMTRNLDRRIEVMYRIRDAMLAKIVVDTVNMLCHDTKNGWVMKSDGTYACPSSKKGAVCAQQEQFSYMRRLVKMPGKKTKR